MKKIVFILLCCSQAVVAQNKKEIPQKVPLEKQIGYSSDEGPLLNNTLKGSAWYFDLKNYDQMRLSFNKDKAKPDVLYFVDAKKFQININQKDCRGLIKGTYKIMKEADENTTVQKGQNSFVITSSPQKCTAQLSRFLRGYVDVSFDENEQVMEMTASEYTSSPVAAPGS
ncbi:hypothetical protein M2347_000116 [Chryseobacterium sp. H1D6B]|uniref:hypothetical protein n=1 Tax=Chryseobacterium sp. H1D6B TaxID=2940588 RepID=UPI0015CC01B9|nr:hypothetical protein [Chryseobacterium sp. H1D6B]MDH6250389.1 hypothetical protein [Chryseobacterium sp. H1D6B]